MYYEEQVILGVLCWRNIPEGAWTEFTAHWELNNPELLA